MKSRTAIFLALIMGWTGTLLAQNDTPEGVIRCYTVEADAALRTKHPELGTQDDFERWLAPLVADYKAQTQSNNRTMAVQTLPVVYHIIHNGTAIGSGDNLSATYINAQNEQLNNDYRRKVGTSGYNTNSVGADSEIEFCMATLDPNGNTMAEPGINRINRNSFGWSSPPYSDNYVENTIKGATQWDPDQYVNIWVVNMSGGILGYAQFPSSSGLSGLSSNGGAASTDGVVVTTSSVGSTVTPNPAGPPYDKGRTLTHELGHWLGLRHIWGDGGCGVDDYCGDTPASDASNGGCPTGHVSCGSVDMVENYMDYTYDDCMNIFTQDQKARMKTVLANSPRRISLVTSDRCGGGGGGGGCATTVSSFPYTEGFESSWGAWTQAGGDDFDWSRLSGSTPSSNTGPSGAAAGSFYVYVESSSPNYSSKTTILEGPCFDLSGASSASFDFQYHMYGASAMGSLFLEARVGTGAWSTVWSLTGNQGNSWLSASVDLNSYAGGSVQLRFRGVTGTTWQGDMAVDDLSLTTGGGGGGGGLSCGATVSSFPYNQGFESGWGDWTDETGDDFDWSRRSGGTPSSNTGPASANEGSWYVYTESSSPNYSNKQAILMSPCFDLSGVSSPSFNFDYHMYGAAAMGSLTLEVSTDGTNWSSLWSRSGNQGNAWTTENVDLSAYSGSTVQLRFNGVTGTTWQGDMAIDNVSLTSGGGGGGGCTTIDISITFDNYPEETSWEIRDGSTVVASGGTYGSQPDGSTLVLNECLADGCYDFVILDSYGDGICCSYGNGSYTVTNGSTVLASGGSFGGSESTNFCLSGGTRTPEEGSAEAGWQAIEGFTLWPNPTRSVLNVRFDARVAGEAMLFVTDLAGRILSTESMLTIEGSNAHTLKVKDLSAGTYMVVVQHGGGRLSKRFVVMD